MSPLSSQHPLLYFAAFHSIICRPSVALRARWQQQVSIPHQPPQSSVQASASDAVSQSNPAQRVPLQGVDEVRLPKASTFAAVAHTRAPLGCGRCKAAFMSADFRAGVVDNCFEECGFEGSNTMLTGDITRQLNILASASYLRFFNKTFIHN